MLKTRSLVSAREIQEVWVAIRHGDRAESMSLVRPTIQVEASDAGDNADGDQEPSIAVRFLDSKSRGAALALDLVAARVLATMLLALADDYDVKAVNPPKEDFLKAFKP